MSTRILKSVFSVLLTAMMIAACIVPAAYADGTHGFYMDTDMKPVKGKADGFMIDFYSDCENALATYYSNANWSMYTRPTVKKLGTNISGGGAYAGLQVTDRADHHTGIMSFWRYEYRDPATGDTAYIYADVMMGKSTHYDNEGSGTSCVMDYNWRFGCWYREMLLCWEDAETGETFMGNWYYDYDNDHWDLFVYYNTHLWDSYISSGVGQFLENFNEGVRETERGFSYRNVYFLDHTTKEWVASPKVNMYSDGNAKAMGETSMGVSDDGTVIWAKVDGKSSVDSDKRETLNVTLKQEEKPTNIGTPEIGRIKVDKRKSLTEEGVINSIIRWEMAEHSTPQLSYSIVVVDKDGNELYKNYQTRPNIQDLSVGNLGTDAYKITLSVTDTFGQTTEKTYESEAYAASEEPTDEPTEPTKGLSTPAIIGIAAGAVVLVGAVIGIVAGTNAKKKKVAKTENTEAGEKTEE